ncbi:prepilin peptidase [Paenibacillus sp. strain BS8-2]
MSGEETTWIVTAAALILIAISVYTDLKERRIYDKITIPGMILFLGFHAITGSFLISAIGLLVLGGFTYLLAVISRGRLGGGDIKLYAMIGAAFGWELGCIIFVMTALLSALWAIPLLLIKLVRPLPASLEEVPLAPFIGAATAIVVVWLVI